MYAISLVLCIFVLGTVLLYFSAQYFVSDRQSTLFGVSEMAADATVENYETNGFIDKSGTEYIYRILAQSTESMIIYTDLDGNVRLCSEGDECTHAGVTIPQTVLEDVNADGEYHAVGLKNLIISGKSRYTVGVGIPLRLSDGRTAGYIFAFNRLETLVNFLADIWGIIQLASLAIIMAVALVMRISIKRMTEPLQEMSRAATSFGRGDFSARVTVEGDDEISSLAKVFNKMADDLVETEATRRTFIANVSHELRTPMTTIGGYIDGILDGTIPKDKQDEYLKIVSEEVKRLSRLTSSTLAIAKMEEGRLTSMITAINVWTILCTVLFSAEKRISTKNITVNELEPTEAYAYGDSDMLHQVLYNLVDNAVKFTPENGQIWVNVTQNKDITAISIKNSGVGIPKSELPFVFDRFYKTDKSRAVDKSGSGLGLYIVKTLVQKMGADIRVESVEDEYCRFTLILTTAPAPAEPQTEPEHKATGLKNILQKRNQKTKNDDRSE